MKRSKLESVIRRKVRVKITRRKRGKFLVVMPGSFGTTVSREFSKKKEALTWLYVQLRCLPEIIFEVKGGAK